MQDIFISYSSADGLGLAEELADGLAAGAPSFPVWLDKQQVHPGLEDWDEQLDRALATCRAVLFVMTADSLAPNSACKDEWTRALEYQKPVIPLRFTPAKLPYRLASHQFVEFGGGVAVGLAELRRHLVWLDSPDGVLSQLRVRLSDANRQLRRVDAERRVLVQAEIVVLEEQLRAQERVVAGADTTRPSTAAALVAEAVQVRRPPSMPIVDRKSELEALLVELNGVVAGEPGGAVLVVGACGVGKSRLVEEVVTRAEGSAVRVLRGQCVGRGAEPLLPVREALSSCLGSSTSQIRHAIATAAPQLMELVPFIERFLMPVAEAVATGPQLGGSSVQGVYAGLERVFHGLAENSGLFLLIEDVHEADQDTLYFLTYLAHKASTSRALAVLTIDDDELPDAPLRETLDDWLVQGWSQVDVDALPDEAIAEYITSVTGQPPTTDVVAVLKDLTAGNTLLLKELLPLVESGTAQALRADITTMTLPRRVRAVLDRRFTHLDRALRAFVETMAVCLDGTPDFAVVPGVLKLDDDSALDFLDQCSRAGLVVETAIGQVRFVHEAMRLAVYASVPDTSRRRLHVRAAEWFDDRGHASSAAHHFLRAGRAGDAARCALRAALIAEHVGMYRSAVTFYQLARRHADELTVGPPLARALIMLGRWDEAEQILRPLPQAVAEVRLVRSDLLFVRGRIRAAAEEIEYVVRGDGARRLDCLIRLADIYLYLGEFATASEYARDALAVAEHAGSVTDRARCWGIVGATLFFAGDVDAAHRRFVEAYELLDVIPEGERDRIPYAVLLDNLGQVAEIHEEWTDAERLHSRALTIRREVFDARGLLHSLHALARACIGMGEVDRSIELLDEAEQLATNIGEPLEHAKITLTRAKLALRNGDGVRALELARDALRRFIECATSFDIAHARLVLARTEIAAGDERRGLTEGASARADVLRRNFGLLSRLAPDVAFSYEARVTAGLRAYACADAFGLPWENLPPEEVDLVRAAAMPARPGWARGATSDDTALTLLVAELLTMPEPDPEPAQGFLRLLSERGDAIPGLGPSTTAAIKSFRETGGLPVTGGQTNGAAMRALPVGWMVPIAEPERRRTLTIALSSATHHSPEAQVAGCVMAACAAWAIEGASPRLLIEVACEEATAAVEQCGADRRIEPLLAAVASGEWTCPAGGVTLHPYETVAAVLWCVVGAASLRDGIDAAVALGGDTDTVAALAAGLIGCGLEVAEIDGLLPWVTDVVLPDDDVVSDLAGALARARVRDDDG